MVHVLYPPPLPLHRGCNSYYRYILFYLVCQDYVIIGTLVHLMGKSLVTRRSSQQLRNDVVILEDPVANIPQGTLMTVSVEGGGGTRMK